jgi:hypothetical protein
MNAREQFLLKLLGEAIEAEHAAQAAGSSEDHAAEAVTAHVPSHAPQGESGVEADDEADEDSQDEDEQDSESQASRDVDELLGLDGAADQDDGEDEEEKEEESEEEEEESEETEDEEEKEEDKDTAADSHKRKSRDEEEDEIMNIKYRRVATMLSRHMEDEGEGETKEDKDRSGMEPMPKPCHAKCEGKWRLDARGRAVVYRIDRNLYPGGEPIVYTIDLAKLDEPIRNSDIKRRDVLTRMGCWRHSRIPRMLLAKEMDHDPSPWNREYLPAFCNWYMDAALVALIDTTFDQS